MECTWLVLLRNPKGRTGDKAHTFTFSPCKICMSKRMLLVDHYFFLFADLIKVDCRLCKKLKCVLKI